MTIGRLWKEGVKVAIHCRMFIQGVRNCTNYSGWCQLYKLYKYFGQMSITSSLMSNLWTTNTCLDELIYHRRYILSLVSLLGGSKNLCQCWISCYLLFIIHFWKNNLKKEHYSKKYLSVCSAAIFVIVSTLNKTFSYLTFLTIPSYDPIFVSLSPRCIWRECLVFFLLLKCLLHVCLSGSFISMRNRWHCVHAEQNVLGARTLLHKMLIKIDYKRIF